MLALRSESPSELGLQHVPRCKGFDLAGRQVRPIWPKPTRRRPSRNSALAGHSLAFAGQALRSSGPGARPVWQYCIALCGIVLFCRIISR
jgi:hypothetical protein